MSRHQAKDLPAVEAADHDGSDEGQDPNKGGYDLVSTLENVFFFVTEAQGPYAQPFIFFVIYEWSSML
jgi:hypothetical protein